MEEERDDDRWELFPWALGMNWQSTYREFLHAKNELWQRMDFRAVVPAKACNQVFSLDAFSRHPAFSRIRNPAHSLMQRHYITERNTKYCPHGPLWHKEAGKAWLLLEDGKSGQDPSLRPCSNCFDHGMHK